MGWTPKRRTSPYGVGLEEPPKLGILDRASAEVLAIGTELTSGRILDTNSHWICGQLAALGAEVRRVTVLPDEVGAIVAALREAVARRPQFLISTGGLGPTPDDVTVEAVARAAGVGTHVHEPTIQAFMQRRGIASREDLPPNLIRMATVPASSQVLPNPAGWAPCLRVQLGETALFVLPGPPREVEAVFVAHVSPAVAQACGRRSTALRLVVDMYESELSVLMQEVMARYPNTYLKAYVALRRSMEEGLPVDVVATAESAEQAESLLRDACGLLCQLVQAKGHIAKRWEK